jgi:hypothetical protein
VIFCYRTTKLFGLLQYLFICSIFGLTPNVEHIMMSECFLLNQEMNSFTFLIVYF